MLTSNILKLPITIGTVVFFRIAPPWHRSGRKEMATLGLSIVCSLPLMRDEIPLAVVTAWDVSLLSHLMIPPRTSFERFKGHASSGFGFGMAVTVSVQEATIGILSFLALTCPWHSLRELQTVLALSGAHDVYLYLAFKVGLRFGCKWRGTRC